MAGLLDMMPGLIGALGFSDVPNWRNREILGETAPGRQAIQPDPNARPAYNSLPTSSNVQDRRGEGMTLGQMLAAPYRGDPFLEAALAILSRTATMRDLHLPLGSNLANAAGLQQAGEFGLTPDELEQFKNGETPGSVPWTLKKIFIPGKD